VQASLGEGELSARSDPAFLTNLPEHESKEEDKGVKINVADLLPAVRTTFRDDGSLTTLPCTEGVAWFIMTNPVQLSVKQIASLERALKRDNRPVQPLNGRTVTVDTTP
jgi:carbonic anhydrase